ncbi:hypothetical protein EPK99_06640 [Neorhizobium lilium]|uniref:Uncharacterized protein n=1 Tax=Neorhizobium lilium TaxID=2503024 RepID=A0A444LGZ5_9HYPH|nr:hypothetical protein [Neorhizobium lilium]RWX78301.1 hypothetical protein EPK99_06640 [Neorhizobium lilium]
MSKITVSIDSSRPIFIEADADNFGQVFANMSDEDQVNVLRAMVEHMKPHRIQWDYISIALEKDENRDVRDQLSVILPDIAAKDAQIERLREDTERLADKIEDLIAEFGDDPKAALECVSEHLQLRRLSKPEVSYA